MEAKNTIKNTFKIHALNNDWIKILLVVALLLPTATFAGPTFPESNSNAFKITNSDVRAQVVDGNTGEPLIAVTVFTDDYKFKGYTDENGGILITDVSHRDEINISYVGYSPIKVPVYQIRRSGGIIKLYANNLIEEIVVIGRTEAAKEELPFQIDRIDQKLIQSRNSQTTVDAIGEYGDVYIQKSQGAGGSPIIRGFEANKVLLVLDGIRMNNAIYRNGHLQNAITVDASMLEQVEVIYGPGSLMYGSEALGGVVHFRTRDPKVVFSGDDILKANVFTRFSTANDEKTIHADVEYGVRKWASLTSLTYADYGDLRAGSKRPEAYPNFGRQLYYVNRNEADMVFENDSDPNVQRGTGFEQIDFLQKIRYQPSDQLYFVANFQYS